eukprot:767928-Hanusia_phi.AAC.3
MFQYIRQRCFQIDSWKYCNKQHVYLKLTQIDTFGFPRVAQVDSKPTSPSDQKAATSLPWKSAIEIYVEHELSSLCDDKLLLDLIEDKWRSHVKWFFIFYCLVPAILYYMLLIANVVVRCMEVIGCSVIMMSASFVCLRIVSSFSSPPPLLLPSTQHLPSAPPLDFWNGKTYSLNDQPEPFLTGFRFDSKIRILSNFLEIFTLFCSAWFLIASWRCGRFQQHDWDPSSFNGVFGWGKKSHEHFTKRLINFLLKNLECLLGFIISLCVMLAFACRLAGSMMFELNLNAISLVLYSYYIFVLCSPFEPLGILSILLFKVLLQSVFLWVIVYIIVLLAFSSAMHTTYRDSKISLAIPNTNFTFQNSFGINVASLLWVSFGEVDNRSFIYESQNQQIAMILNMTWAVFSCILVLNFLIALISRFFDQKYRDAEHSWSIMFAYTVIRYEKIYSWVVDNFCCLGLKKKRTGQKNPEAPNNQGADAAPRAEASQQVSTAAQRAIEKDNQGKDSEICPNDEFFWEFVADWHTGMNFLFEAMTAANSSELLPFSAPAQHCYLKAMEEWVKSIFVGKDKKEYSMGDLMKNLVKKCAQLGTSKQEQWQSDPSTSDLEVCDLNLGQHMISYEALKAASVKLQERKIDPVLQMDPQCVLDYQLFTDILIYLAHYLEVVSASILRSASNVAKADGVSQVSKIHMDLGISLVKEMFAIQENSTIYKVKVIVDKIGWQRKAVDDRKAGNPLGSQSEIATHSVEAQEANGEGRSREETKCVSNEGERPVQNKYTGLENVLGKAVEHTVSKLGLKKLKPIKNTVPGKKPR